MNSQKRHEVKINPSKGMIKKWQKDKK